MNVPGVKKIYVEIKRAMMYNLNCLNTGVFLSFNIQRNGEKIYGGFKNGQSILYKLSYGLYAIGAQDGACIANTVFQITSTPAVIALSMNKKQRDSRPYPKIRTFSVSILNEDVPSEIISTLGFASSRDTDKFTGLPWKKINGLPVLEKRQLWLSVMRSDILI